MQKKVDDYTYKTSDVIGYGSTSVVYLGNSIYTGQVVAIRVITLARLIPQEQVNLQNQLSVLNYLPYHPNVVKVHKLLKTQNHIYVVTEYCDAKLDITGNYDVNVIADGIIEGIKHLIKNNVIHRDLKPQNIMLKNGVPKLIDFGFARRLSNLNEYMYEYLGTPYYMSPQILDQQYYTSKTDIWSLGVLLYQILYRVLPFDALTHDQLLRKIKTTAPIITAGYNNVLAILIQGCLIIDENKRYSWDDVFILASQLKKGGLKQRPKNSLSPIRFRSKSSNQSLEERAFRPIQNNFGYGY